MEEENSINESEEIRLYTDKAGEAGSFLAGSEYAECVVCSVTAAFSAGAAIIFPGLTENIVSIFSAAADSGIYPAVRAGFENIFSIFLK